MADEYSSLTEDQATEQATIVLNNLIDSLAKHFGLMKSTARTLVRQAMQEL